MAQVTRDDNLFISLFGSLLVIFMVVFTLTAGGCGTNPAQVTETLQKSGYTDVQPGSNAWFACGEGDKAGRSFSAVNPTGQVVSGVVCCGVFKGCTVRF